MYHDLIIAGGGAAGLIAAIAAKDYGADVAIIEGTDRVGKKLLTTGNGRCNISNKNIKYPFNNYHSHNKKFYEYALKNFTVEDTENFFLGLGLPLITLQDGKMYPQSLQASSVLDILRMAVSEKMIPVYTNCKITEVSKKKNFNLITSNKDYDDFSCKKLLLACGGKSAVKTGSDGSGYKLAKSLGHKLIPQFPGIVQLKLNYPFLKSVSGVKFNGKASIYADNKFIKSDEGEILFTDYGISGPPILQLSYFAAKNIQKGKKVTIRLDMFPEKSEEETEEFFKNHFLTFGHREISSALIGIIPKKLISTILKDSGIKNIHVPCCNIEYKSINCLIKKFRCWEFECVDTNGFNNAQVTSGGVDVNEVNSSTFESKLVNSLFFAGEILDVNGDCGGYNLQWAWSSGYLAGKAAARKRTH